MKRSSSLKLVLMATTAFALTACSEEPKTKGAFYKTVGECVAQGKYTSSQCDEAYTAAKSHHANSAPRYSSSSLCTEQHGAVNCQRVSGAGHWSPFLAGFFVSGLVDNVRGWNNLVRPVYSSRYGGYYDVNGYSLGRAGTKGEYSVSEKSIKTKPKAAKVQTRTTVAARGGFGSRSSWSGS